jgi:hypothetical protein
MTTGITNNTFVENAYITVAEFKNAPTSIDYDNLVIGGNAAAQDAELARVIMRASSFMNEYLNQNLVADQITETQRARVTGQGWIALHPNNSNVIALESFQYGPTPTMLATLNDCSQVWFENQQIIIPLAGNTLTYSSQGPLSFGAYSSSPYVQMFCQYTYVAGFVNTLATGTLGASQVTVAAGTGILAGQVLTIFDGAKTERVTVSSTYTYGSTTVPLTAPLVFDHAAVAISNLPTTIKQACILLTTAFLKTRGDGSMTMNITTAPTSNITGDMRYSSEIRLALDMVGKYRRIR